MNKIDHLNEHGYAVWKTLVSPTSLYILVYHKDTFDIPLRGHDINGNYYECYHRSVEWANYWTLPLNQNNRVREIRANVDPVVEQLLDRPVFYHADASVLTELNNTIRPHIDTPHRHKPWNKKIDRRLGIQVAMPMHDMKVTAGITAFVPGSHRKYWDIKKCYRGDYTQQFLRECEQPQITYGDMIVWDARTLHSQMPNVSHSSRYMLIMNYLEEDVVQDVMQYEASLHA